MSNYISCVGIRNIPIKVSYKNEPEIKTSHISGL